MVTILLTGWLIIIIIIITKMKGKMQRRGTET